MAAADYRLMTEATGLRIAAALESLVNLGDPVTIAHGGTGASTAAAALAALGGVAVTDIVNNLTSTATDKPGSANMLKTLNDKITNNSVIGSSAITTTHTIFAARLARVGHLAVLTATIELTSNVPAWTSVFKISDVRMDASTYVVGDVSNETKMFYVGVDGSVSCTSALTSEKEIKITIPMAVI